MKICLVQARDGGITAVIELEITEEEYHKLIANALKNRILEIKKDMHIERYDAKVTEDSNYVCRLYITFHQIVEVDELKQTAQTSAMDFMKAISNLDLMKQDLSSENKEDEELRMKLQFCRDIVEGKEAGVIIDNNFFKELCASYVCIHEPDVDYL